MSLEQPIELLEDNDDDDDLTLDKEEEEKISLFMEFTKCSNRSVVLSKLRNHGFDVQRALLQEFQDDQERNKEKAIPEKPLPVSSCANNNSDNKKKVENTRGKKVAPPPPKKEPERPLMSIEWYNCMAQSLSSSSSSSTFVDPDFPPTQSSIDGRRQQSKQGKTVYCPCGVPAKPRTVQSDGPNYGRFYLCCGNNARRNSKQQQQQCKFFQWDNRQGSKGAGYATRYTLMDWAYFGSPGCVLVRKHYSPSAVRQGAIGNCWFLSALAVVAEKQYLVQQLLPQREVNRKGCYQVNLCLDGQWTPVIVDSHLPVVHGKRAVDPARSRAALTSHAVACQSPQPAFCDVPNGELWPALIEKAYAKAHGSYTNLSGGYIQEAFGDLTGAPTETLVFGGNCCWDADTLWARLVSFHEAGFLMGVATSQGGNGLVGGHAYSVLEVLEAHDAIVGQQTSLRDFCDEGSSPKKRQRTTVRLVRIRNPWGKKDWKGEWSANSDKWTKALRRRLGEEQSYAKGEGIFFMSFSDMVQRFHHMDVAKCRKGWTHTSLDGNFRLADPLTSSQHCYTIQATEKSWGFISLVQPKKRANTLSGYWYADPSILVLKRRHNDKHWETEAVSLNGFVRSCTVEVFLDPQYEYCCVPFSCKLHGGEARFRVGAYCANQVTMQTQPHNPTHHRAALRFIHRRLVNDERKLVYRVAHKAVLLCVLQHRCLYLVAVNAATDKFVSLHLGVKIPNGVLAAYGLARDTHDIGPQSQRILLVVASDGTQSSATSISFTYVSDAVTTNRDHARQPADKTRKINLNSAIDISLAGEMVVAQAGGPVRGKGGDTIETFQWLNQIGSSV